MLFQITDSDISPLMTADEALIYTSEQFIKIHNGQLETNRVTMITIRNLIYSAINKACKKGQPYTSCDLSDYINRTNCHNSTENYQKFCNTIIQHLSDKKYKAHIVRNSNHLTSNNVVLHIFWGNDPVSFG